MDWWIWRQYEKFCIVVGVLEYLRLDNRGDGSRDVSLPSLFNCSYTFSSFRRTGGQLTYQLVYYKGSG